MFKNTEVLTLSAHYSIIIIDVKLNKLFVTGSEKTTTMLKLSKLSYWYCRVE